MEQSNAGNPGKSQKKGKLLFGGLIAVGVLGYAAFVLIAGGNRAREMNPVSISSVTEETSASEDSAVEKAYEAETVQLQQTLQELTDRSKFGFSIHTQPSFANGESEGTLFIKNSGDNSLKMRVTIRLDDTGETVYESGLIAPGETLKRDKLNKALPEGDYPATAIITPLDASGNGLASLEATITLMIGGEEMEDVEDAGQ